MSKLGDDLTAILNKVIPIATFEIRRLGTYSAAEIKDFYLHRHPTDIFRIGTARPVLDIEDSSEIERVLRIMLASYIEDDRIGNGLALVVGGMLDISVQNLVDGVVRAAAILGAEETTRRVERWARGKRIHYQMCALLDGLSLEQPVEVDGGIRLDILPASSPAVFAHLPLGADLDLASSSVMGKSKVTIECNDGPAFFLPSERTFAANGSVHRSWAVGPVPADFWGVFCKSLSLASNRYVDWVVQWAEFAEGEPFGWNVLSGRSSQVMDGQHAISSNQPVSLSEINHALEIFPKLSAEGNVDRRLSLAIDRWVTSKGRRAFADQIIDLRVGLEALFGVDGGGEIAYRMASRGAWYLGSDPKDRKCIYDSLKEAYNDASSVIHGRPERDNQKLRSVLTHGQDLCRRAILKRMENSSTPDWDDITMGAR